MSQSTTLRRIPGDSPGLLKRLAVLEKFISDGEIEPWMAVLVAEWTRQQSANGMDMAANALPPPGKNDMLLLLKDPDLLAVMKEQADGPWDVYVAQGESMLRTDSFANSLIALWEAGMVEDKNQQTDQSSTAQPPAAIQHQFDVVVSYAGVDRDFVQRVVRSLQGARLRVFYDDTESHRAHMVGRDLDSEIVRLYQREASNCIVFLSSAYAASEWTMMELRAALARAGTEPGYMKPVRLDDTGFADVPKAMVYFDARPGRLLADPALLSELLIKSVRGPHATASGRGDDAIVSESDESVTKVREYFQTVLPAMLRWRKNATTIGGSVHYSISGRIKEDWLVRLGPPEASVSQINLQEEPNIAVLPRHLRIRLTVREMAKMLRGDYDARQSLIDGNTELAGDLSLLKEIGHFFQGKETP